MPTKKRITVSVSDKLYETLTRIGENTGQAKHAILSEMLAPCEPVLDQLLECLIQAKLAREKILPSLARAMDHLAGVVDEGTRQLRQVAEEARAASHEGDTLGPAEGVPKRDESRPDLTPY